MLQSFKDDAMAAAKVSIAWLLAKWDTITSVSSAEIAQYLAIVYTLVSLYVLVRDKIVRRRERIRVAKESDYTTL